MLAVLVGETGPLRAIFRVTGSPRLTLVLVGKPPRLGLSSSSPRQELVPVWHWFSLTTGIGLGQVTAIARLGLSQRQKRIAMPKPNASATLRRREGSAQVPSGRRLRMVRFFQAVEESWG